MMNLQVIQKFSNSPLIEAMQQQKLRYAFVKPTGNDTYETITPYVLCRDYLKDMLYCKFITKKGIGEVYGFDTNKYSFADIVKEKTLLAITGSKELIDNIEENWNYLIEVETKHGVLPTEAIRFEKDGVLGIIVEGDPRWQQSLLGFSYYTFLFRWMTYKNMSVNHYDDQCLALNAQKLATKTIDEINQFGFLKTSVKDRLYDLHNHYGLYFVKKNTTMPGCDTNPYAVLDV